MQVILNTFENIFNNALYNIAVYVSSEDKF